MTSHSLSVWLADTSYFIKLVNAGVPQGSLLGLLPLPLHIFHLGFIIFSSDFTYLVYMEDSKMEASVLQLSSELHKDNHLPIWQLYPDIP